MLAIAPGNRARGGKSRAAAAPTSLRLEAPIVAFGSLEDSGGIEVVTTSACGSMINWTRPAAQVAPLPFPDFKTVVGSPAVVAGERHSGMRLVRVRATADKGAMLREIQRASGGVPFRSMLFFDDRAQVVQ